MARFLLILIIILTLLGHLFSVSDQEFSNEIIIKDKDQSLGTQFLLDFKETTDKYLPETINTMGDFVTNTFTSEVVYTSDF